MTEYTIPYGLPLPQPADKIAALQESMRLSLCGISEATNRELGGLDEKIGAIAKDYVSRGQSYFRNVVVGEDALKSATGLSVRTNEAFGIGALQSATRARFNTAIGYNALYSLDAGPDEPDSTMKASRNTAVGSNTQRFNATGYNNVSMGRNSLQNNTRGSANVALGAGAISGASPVGLNGIIANQIPQDISETVAIGTEALMRARTDGNVAVGHQVLRLHVNGIRNVGVGHNALANMGSLLGPDGRMRTDVAWRNLQYTISGTVLTVVKPDHGLALNNMLRFETAGHEYQHLHVNGIIDNDTFTLGIPGNTPDESGTCDIPYFTSGPTGGTHNYNAAVGSGALYNLVGDDSKPTKAASNTALGVNALRNMQDGSPALHLTSAVGLGQGASVSGSNQVQLGANDATVYAGQAIQLRSDARDKTDVQDTSLGLDFINSLRAVDYRWDRRSSYYERDESGAIINITEPDGTRKGSRFHHGFIAQEVQAVIDSTGIDFGGFQDHKINGGSDVLSIGYEEFIAPIVKSIQELAQRTTKLEEAA